MLGETSLRVVGLVSDLFREVSEETLYTSENMLRSVRVGGVGGHFSLLFRVSLRCRAWRGVHLRVFSEAIKGGVKTQINF